ncbi:Gfo/Idh/MocA family protein [Paenibacillus solisilvae]|uniref:Gfo/Idh/MocA family protein n=1 Tax=Paenibacillus solisilvae TaxID=2486751 RepID=A0ABW0W2H1_9BACL
MSNRTVGIAVIGCGDIVMTQHLPALMENSSVTVTAVCDTDPLRAEKAGMISGCAYHTTDYLRILADTQVEAVIVCTPPWVTPDITMDALRAGKDVLCEKPMATSVTMAEKVAAVERQSGRLLQVGFTYRHGPLMDALQDWIASGRLGRPLQIRLGIYDEVWDPEGNPEHYQRILNTLRHGPPCIHDGAHAADHLAFLTNSHPIRVAALGLATRPEFPAANYNSALIEFANGDQAKLEIGWFYPHLPAGEFQILGPGGLAYLDRSNNEAVLKTGEVTERVQLSEDRVRSCFRAQLTKFLDYHQSRRTPVPGSREGIASLRLSLAIVEAMDTGNPVDMKQGDIM